MREARRRWLAVLPVAFAVLCVLPARASAESLFQAYLHGMALGNGHDSYSATNKMSCVIYEVVSSNTSGAVKGTNWYWSLVESNQDLFEKTSVSASASVSTVTAHGSAEASMIQQNQLSMYNVNVLSLVDVDLRWDYATQVRLKPGYERLLAEDPEAFIEKCGNYYVSGIRYGGSFYNLITISTSSQTDKETVSAKVSGGYGPFSASVSASKETIDTLTSRKATIKGYSTGSGGGAIPLDPASMTTRVQGFEQEVLKSGGTMTGVLLDAYPASRAGADPKIWNMASKRWDYVSLRREIAFAAGNPGQFYMEPESWRPRLAELGNMADNAIGALDRALQACRADRNACVEPAGIPDAGAFRRNLPPRYSGACGKQDLDIGGVRMEVWPLSQRCGGDTEMKGHNPSITLEAKLRPENRGKRVDMAADVTMKEDRRDWTCFRDTRSMTVVYDLEKLHPGCFLTDPLPTGSLSANGGKNNHRWTTYSSGTGIVKSAECLSDTKGRDDGKLGCRSIAFLDKIPMTLGHDEDREGPNVYSAGSLTQRLFAPVLKVLKSLNPFTNRANDIGAAAGKKVITSPAQRDAEPPEPR